jgi:hypothetical protein
MYPVHRFTCSNSVLAQDILCHSFIHDGTLPIGTVEAEQGRDCGSRASESSRTAPCKPTLTPKACAAAARWNSASRPCSRASTPLTVQAAKDARLLSASCLAGCAAPHARTEADDTCCAVGPSAPVGLDGAPWQCGPCVQCQVVFYILCQA